MAARRGPGRLRRGGLQGPRRGHRGQAPDGHLPALQRRAHPGPLGRDGRVRLPGAPQRLRVRRRRAQEGGLRQRHRGRQARRRGGEGVGALPPPRGPLRTRPHLHQPPTRATSRTRSAATGGTHSSPSRRSTTPAHSTAGRSRTASTRARASATTGSARPSPSRSGRTGRRSRRCRRRRSRARGGGPGGAASREQSRSARRTATRPAPPTRAARSPSPSAPSTSRSATARPGRSSPPTSASGAPP